MSVSEELPHSVAGPFRSGNWPNGLVAACERSDMLAKPGRTGISTHDQAGAGT
jgi:hypothetical protein